MTLSKKQEASVKRFIEETFLHIETFERIVGDADNRKYLTDIMYHKLDGAAEILRAIGYCYIREGDKVILTKF